MRQELNAKNANLLMERNTPRYKGRSQVQSIGSGQVRNRKIPGRSEQNRGAHVSRNAQLNPCDASRFYEHHPRVSML